MAHVKLKHGQAGTLKIGYTMEVSEEEAKALVACGTFEDITKEVEAVIASKAKNANEDVEAQDSEAETTKTKKK